MKTIVGHQSPDLDVITSAWIIKRFLEGWEDAEVKFAPAGEKLEGLYKPYEGPIELLHDSQIIHVDTGLGPLDHHQTQDENTCAASLTFDFVKNHPHNSLTSNSTRLEAVRRIVEFTIDEDHFQEVHLEEPASTLYDFSVARLVDGFKVLHPQEDTTTLGFGMECLDAILHVLEQRIWAEEEIKEKGLEFTTRFGKALAIESVNDMVLEIAQKMGYVLTVRKDPKHGNIRIKAKPNPRKNSQLSTLNFQLKDVDLTSSYEKLRSMDPKASWFLHVSKKMLLNGSSKNPQMQGSKLSLTEVIEVLKSL